MRVLFTKLLGREDGPPFYTCYTVCTSDALAQVVVTIQEPLKYCKLLSEKKNKFKTYIKWLTKKKKIV